MNVYKIPVLEIAADPDTFRQEYIAMRQIGNEWLAAVSPVVYGTLDIPPDGEPAICLVLSADGTKITPQLYVLQHLFGNTWMNCCYSRDVFEFTDGERVVPLSGVSRMVGMEVDGGPRPVVP